MRLGTALLAPLAVCAVLAGCDRGGPPGEDEIAAQAAKLQKPLPGRYTSISELVEFELPGVSPEEADRIGTRMFGTQGQTRSYCLTPAEADKGFEDVLRKMQDGDCSFSSFAVEDGNLSAAMACTNPQGHVSHVMMEGTGTAENSHMRLTVDRESPALPAGKLHMVIEVDNLREGDCH